MKNTFGHFRLFAVLFFLLCATSCADISDIDGDGASGENMPPLVREAICFMDGKTQGLSMLRLGNTEKLSRQPSDEGSTKLSVVWDEYEVYEDGTEQTVVFPIKHKTTTATTMLLNRGRAKKIVNKVASKLIVRKRADGSHVAVIGTYL